MELQKQIAAPSFTTRHRSTKQIDMIVELLQWSINEKKQISLDDIIKTYLDWREANGKAFYVSRINTGWKERDEHYYKRVILSREDFAKEYYTQQHARNWFKNNLGAAIIQGRILAIPVINI